VAPGGGGSGGAFFAPAPSTLPHFIERVVRAWHTPAFASDVTTVGGSRTMLAPPPTRQSQLHDAILSPGAPGY